MLEKEQESKENARVFEESMRESFASYDLDTSSWRTSALSLFGGSMSYSETWPRAGMMRNGISYRLQPLVPRTSAKGSGLWLTPTATERWCKDETEIVLTKHGTPRRKYKNGATSSLGLASQVAKYPTPRTRGLIGGSGSRQMLRDKVENGDLSLEEAEQMIAGSLEPARMAVWPTPNCLGYRSDGELKILARTAKDRAEYLAMSTKAANSKRERHWPTPRAADFKGAVNPSPTTAKRVASGEANLPEAVVESQRIWPTPTSGKLQLDTLDRAVQGDQPPTGQLNPMFVCWLMGYPKHWTRIE